MKPLYIVGTRRDVGKTTFCVGLISALRRRGLRVGYTKPLGQRVTTHAGKPIHDDALVVSQSMHLGTDETGDMAVALTSGRVEKEVFDLHVPELAEKVTAVYRHLQDRNDMVIVEGMGHVAMGSCIMLSAGDVARLLGARPLLISGGGIGRAIDSISLCATFMEAKGAPLMGVVINKVWPEKYTRVREATTKGLANLGIRSFGCVPYEQVLASPTMRQVAHKLGGEILCGTDALENRVENIIVAAMESHHMVPYLKDRALVITPGDRSDNILAILSTSLQDKDTGSAVSGIVLTGGFRPSDEVISLLAQSKLPALLCSEDTYTLASRLRDTVFKLTPDDKDRIEAAMCLITEYVDIDAILERLHE